MSPVFACPLHLVGNQRHLNSKKFSLDSRFWGVARIYIGGYGDVTGKVALNVPFLKGPTDENLSRAPVILKETDRGPH